MANICLMAGGTLGLLAPARFYQAKVQYSVVVLALVVGILGLLLHTVWNYSIAFAMVGVCASMAVVMLYTVRVVYTHSPRPVPFAAHVLPAVWGLWGWLICCVQLPFLSIPTFLLAQYLCQARTSRC